MKLLFLSAKDVNKRSNGGELCTNRNYLSFCELLGKDNVTAINLLSDLKSGIFNAINKRINFLFGFYEGLNHKKVREIIELSGSHDFVFIDSSIHGSIAYHLKKGKYKGEIISFFHNVEYGIKLQKAKIQPWKIAEIFVTRYSEKCACRYSDHVVALNNRDKEELRRLYNTKDITIIPISLHDRYDGTIAGMTSIPPKFIFTGNNWYANLHGLDWFIENVLDHVDIKLQITGYKMDSLKDKYIHPKIEFLGFVDNLDPLMKDADFVLIPVFLGSGMKVKTCEALMYGKNIIGTTEAFEGYTVDPDKVGAICNTNDEFIQSIRKLCSSVRDKFNLNSRDYFLQLYSFEATLLSFKKLIE